MRRAGHSTAGRNPYPCHTPGGLAASGASQQQARATGAQQQVRQTIKPARLRAIGQVKDEQVDEAAAGQPAGQLHRLGGVGGADDQQPLQRNAQPDSGRRIESA